MVANFVEFVIVFGLAVSAIGLLLELFAPGDIRKFGVGIGILGLLSTSILLFSYTMYVHEDAIVYPALIAVFLIVCGWLFAMSSYNQKLDERRGRRMFD